MYDSLRDLIPALTGRMFRRKGLDDSDGRDFWALEDVSFEVKKGEAFGIIGHNGAGKSTMLKILSRIMQPTEGQMVVHGRLSALIEVSAGFHSDLTGRENIFLNGTILGMSRREIESKLDAIIDFSGLEDFIDTPVKRYSSGMFARLGFSVAAHVDPEVLIVDEVLSVGDFVFQEKCIARMNEILSGGTTVLFVSHNLRAVGDLCQRGLLLDSGKVSTIGKMSDVINSYMQGIRDDQTTDDTKAARITDVTMRRGDKECVQFKTTEKACVDIMVVAGGACRRMAVVLYFTDEEHYEFFSTSTERLGHAPYDMNPGDELNCRFEVDLNMASGTYHLCAMLYRYDTESVIDTWQPAGTFFVDSENIGSKGIVNCNPKLAVSENVCPDPS
jgi:lipopolysaccharide transport system ATP-binding protein